LNEKPQANIKKGDKVEMYKDRCEIKEHRFGYRSVHYLISHPMSKDDEQIVEIQIRTLFEEAWSEIDHKIRYPYDINNIILSGYLEMFSGLAGSADEMGSFIMNLKEQLDLKNRESEKLEERIDELQRKIEGSKLDSEEKEEINSELADLTVGISKSNINNISLLEKIKQASKPMAGLRKNNNYLSKNEENDDDDNEY
jgi:SMC interacting uncharacterized protein involved in chromosome segregation